MGHEVTVCTGMPFYPQWQIHPNYTRKLSFREEHNSVTILRSWMWVPEKVTSAKRVLFEASFLATSLLNAVRSRKTGAAVRGVTAFGSWTFSGATESVVEYTLRI